jgi:chromosome segregation ATPase
MERLRHENDILYCRTLQSLDKDLELQVVYHHLSEAEHGWNYNRQQLDLAREEVDTWTHAIVHLEHAIEMQNLELEERTMTITTLKQQLQVLQLQAPPAPEDPAEPDVVSDINED